MPVKTLKLGPRGIFRPRNAKMEFLSVREAWGITIDGFEEFTFRLYKMDGLWAIAELTTGLPITRGHGSKHEAHDKAVFILDQRGLEMTRKAIAYQLGRITDQGITEQTA